MNVFLGTVFLSKFFMHLSLNTWGPNCTLQVSRILTSNQREVFISTIADRLSNSYTHFLWMCSEKTRGPRCKKGNSLWAQGKIFIGVIKTAPQYHSSVNPLQHLNIAWYDSNSLISCLHYLLPHRPLCHLKFHQ